MLREQRPEAGAVVGHAPPTGALITDGERIGMADADRRLVPPDAARAQDREQQVALLAARELGPDAEALVEAAGARDPVAANEQPGADRGPQYVRGRRERTGVPVHPRLHRPAIGIGDVSPDERDLRVALER